VETVRLLARRSELGYTNRPAQALPLEPEAVPAAVQRRLSEEAKQRSRARDRAEWVAARARLQLELDYVRARPWSRTVRDDLRALQRLLDRLDRLLR
jgi:hypothetical protein